MKTSNPTWLISQIGFAQKSGNVTSGTFAVIKSVDKRKARLVIVAQDLSGNSFEKIRDKCSKNGIPIIRFATKDTLGHYIGKEYRAVISINNDNFAKTILSKWEGERL